MGIQLKQAPVWDLFWSSKEKKEICKEASNALTSQMFFEFGKIAIGTMQEESMQKMVAEYGKNMEEVMLKYKESGSADSEVYTQVYSALEDFINSNDF